MGSVHAIVTTCLRHLHSETFSRSTTGPCWCSVRSSTSRTTSPTSPTPSCTAPGTRSFLVDTGVTDAFRGGPAAAIDRVGPWTRLVVLTTHGHPDHVGNNDLADELGRERGVPRRALRPGAGRRRRCSTRPLLDPLVLRIAGMSPLPAPPKLAGDKVVSLFQPLRPFAAVTRTYEELPLRADPARRGPDRPDGRSRTVRSRAAQPGPLRRACIVHLRDSGLVHLADEGNGPCGVMQDADQLKLQTVLGAVAALFENGQATVLTDGHTFAVRRGAEAASYLDGLLDQAMALQQLGVGGDEGPRSVKPGVRQPLRARRRGARGRRRQSERDVHRDDGGQPARRDRPAPRRYGSGASWSRPALTNPAPVSGMPHGLALLPAAVEMLHWKLQKKDR